MSVDLERLDALVKMSSQSRDFEGVAKVQETVSGFLDQMGFTTQLIESEMQQSGPFLRASFNPQGPLKLVFVCHADCVRSNKQAAGLEVRGERLYGIGIADNKGGIVAALRTLELLLSGTLSERLKNLWQIEFLCSPSEETGSLGWHQTLAHYGRNADFCLGYEPALANGSMIVSRSGNRWYDISLKGQSSHSGRVGHAHLNAAHELAHKIVQLHELHRPDLGIKVNVGSIQGGLGVFNVTCGEISLKLDVRYTSYKMRDSLHSQIQRIVENHRLDASFIAEMSLADDCPPMQQTPHQQFLDSLVQQGGISFAHSGGAADINYLPTPRVVALDGLGPIGHNLHEKRESIELASLHSRPILVADALEVYAKDYASSALQPVLTTL